MRHILGRAKGEIAIEHIKNFTQGEEKLLVFGHHQDVLSIIEDSMKGANISYVRVDGTTPAQVRQDAVDRFQTEKDCLVFLTSTAMGMGVTLTAASNALFVERQWSPSVEEQMEDRIHRIGQTKGVVIWYMQATNTIDELLANIVEAKRELLAELLDSDQKISNRSIMKELMKEMSRG
jgi:SWI/SNF-related matrix-associated actin-dependent regulator 1 of chromatin subfamily A